MLRGLHTKLVMIMVLLILSLMMVVGAFLVNSVAAFYLNDFYSQMSDVFNDSDLVRDLQTETASEENGAEMIFNILSAYSGDLGVDSRGNRNFFILDGQTGDFLFGTDPVTGAHLEYTNNLLTALSENSIGDDSDMASRIMDLAIPITRGETEYIIYILDNKAIVTSLTNQIVLLIMESLIFGLIISILLSFLLSKTMITPIQRLTEGALRLAKGDFSTKLQVASSDEIGVLTGTFNDMAGQLQDTIRQVENERNKLGTLFLHMTDGVVAFSHEGQVIHSNPAAEEMLHCAINDATTYVALFGTVIPLDIALTVPDYLEAELTVEARNLQLLVAPFDRDRQGGVLVVIYDVTQQRRHEEMRREFVANVSHELRTPLTNIRSYAETLAENTGDLSPDIEQKFLGVILNESDRMTHIVQDLLTLSRFDSGHDDLKLTQFSFVKAVSDLYSAVYMEAQKHNHTLHLDVDQNTPMIVADRERILQVMMNITSNAIKYTPDGGEIIISAGQCEDMVWMQVEDNGIGIPAEDRPRIFDRFYRVDKARSRQSGGTGLGLSIAKELINSHQGTLNIVDKDSEGLSIRMELKIAGPIYV